MKECQVIYCLAFFKTKTIMKKFLQISLMLVAFVTQAQDYNVTFSVNTSNIEVGPNGMYVGDGVLGGSDAYAMSDDHMDGVWEVTISLGAGTEGNYAFSTAQYHLQIGALKKTWEENPAGILIIIGIEY